MNPCRTLRSCVNPRLAQHQATGGGREGRGKYAVGGHEKVAHGGMGGKHRWLLFSIKTVEFDSVPLSGWKVE